jgi:hypothetical protein
MNVVLLENSLHPNFFRLLTLQPICPATGLTAAALKRRTRRKQVKKGTPTPGRMSVKQAHLSAYIRALLVDPNNCRLPGGLDRNL